MVPCIRNGVDYGLKSSILVKPQQGAKISPITGREALLPAIVVCYLNSSSIYPIINDVNSQQFDSSYSSDFRI